MTTTKFIIICSIAILSAFSVQAQGIEFFKGDWSEALAKANQEDKLIFVDAYASWCGPCKRMARSVFPQEEVGAFYNENFISLKIDMEKGMGLEFRKDYPVSAFPTLFFINGDGKVVQKVKGAQTADKLIALGRTVLSQTDSSPKFAELYEAGNREPQMMYNYVKALNKAGKPSLKIANEYFSKDLDYTSEFNAIFLLEATTEVDSRIFDLLVQNRSAVEKHTGTEALEKQIFKASKATLKKALEFNNLDLLQEAKSAMKDQFPAESLAFGLKADMDFYGKQKDVKKYLKSVKKFRKAVATDAKKQYNLSITIMGTFPKDKAAAQMAENYAKTAAESGGLSNYWLNYATLLDRNGKRTEAIAAAKEALKNAKENSMDKRKADAYLRKLEESSGS